MRPLEIVYLLLNLPLLIWCVFNVALPAWGRIVPIVTLVFMAVDIALDGARWTMAPAFVVTCWLFVACTWPRVIQPGRWSSSALFSVLLTSGVLATLLPVFELPKPTGPYGVGTVTRHLIDTSRREIHDLDKNGPRELMIQVWYPTRENGPGKPYRASNEVSWSKQHLALVRTHAVEDASLATDQDQFPLLIFEPSWTGRRNQNTVQAEELASKGYLVVGIEHPYSADLTVFPDGRKTTSTLGEFLDCASDASVAACLQASREQLAIRSADARFVLDEFERLDRAKPADRFAGHIDFSRVGIFGHSFGGAVAAEVCRCDRRFKAGVNYDGLIFGDVLDQGIGKPFLFLMDGTPIPSESELEHNKGPYVRELILVAENYDCLRHHPEERGYWASIKGASHMNFCDSPLYTPIRRLTHGGPIEPSRCFQIINAFTVAFFNTYLKGAPDPFFDGSVSAYPEIELENLYLGDRLTYSHKPRKQLAKEHP